MGLIFCIYNKIKAMITQDLLLELLADDIDFNGNVELSEDNTIIWSLKFEPEVVEEGEELDELTPEEELIDALEDDIEYIYAILDEYEMDFDCFELEDEFSFDGETLTFELFVCDEDEEEVKD